MFYYEEEKELVKIAYQCIILILTHPWFQDKSVEDVIQWVHSQYKSMGWKVESVGSEWGLLYGRCPKN